MRLRTPAALAALVALALAASSCSGDDEKSDADPSSSSGSASPSVAETPYLDVPDGVELTAQGSELSVGQRATVAYQATPKVIGVLDIKVTELQKADYDTFVGWQITKSIRSRTPYFVRATVKNVGEEDLGGRTVPLYIVDGTNQLVEPSVFQGDFKQCESSIFPEKFKKGDHVRTCLVFLSPDHGDLTAVSFRPNQDFDPITWTGKLIKAGAEKKKPGGKSSGGDGKKSGGKKKSGGDRKKSSEKKG